MDNNLKNVKNALDEFLKNTKEKTANQDRAAFVGEVSREVMQIFAPVLQEMALNSKINKEDLADVIRQIQVVAPEVNIPEIRIPEFKIPTPQVTVNVPKAETPIVNVSPSDVSFPDSMAIHGFDYKNPMPVRLVDLKGRPMEATGGGSSGPGFPMEVLDKTATDPAIRVTGNFSISASNSSTQAIDSSGQPYSQANPFPVVFGSSGTTGTNLLDSSGVAYSGSNPVPVVITSGASATSAVNVVDSSGIAYSGSNPAPFRIVTDATATVNVVNVDSAGAYRSTFPVSGSVAVSGVTGSIGATILNGEGVSRDTWGSSQVGTWNITTLTGITNSLQSALIDSTGVQYSGSNPVPVNTVAGGPDSMFVLQARTTFPTAVSDGADVRMTGDKLGRAMSRPINVRELISTAYVSLTTGTEATLATASAGQYLDLIMITATNNSSAATQLDIRAVSGGNIIHTMYLPASTGPVGFTPPVPWPQDATGNAWTVDMPDQTGTTVYISALFSKEL